ncbi:MAG: SusC/RagA family TonB-linked outer membrane protein [Cyclobacteriaceae bacterium]
MRVNSTNHPSSGRLSLLKIGMLSLVVWMLAIGDVLAQANTITGKVTSAEDGNALPGVNVIVTGTSVGTVTDIDGNYRLNVPSDAESLSFSFIGLKDQVVQINGRSTINVTMQEDAQQLSEVVVTAIGIEQDRRKLAYSIQEIESEEITRAPQTNLVNSINGKVAGVNIVSSSGTPGASAAIRVRGNTSITGNNSPLFVVDGVPISNDEIGGGVGGVDNSNRAIDINPNDVASMTVLKGPAATALYGIRAANGAIIITTKKGKKGEAPTVNLNTTWEVNEVNRFLDMQGEYAQGANGVYGGPETQQLWSWGPRIETLAYDGDEDYLFSNLGRLVPRDQAPADALPGRAYDNPANFFVRGLTSDNNISVRGGTEKSNYYLSAGYLNNQGIIPNSEFERITLRTTVSTAITDKLTASLSANYVNSGGVRPERGSNLRGIMLGLIRNTPTFDLGAGKVGRDAANDPSVYEFPDGTQRSYRWGIYDSPYWVVNKNYTTDDVNRIFGYASLNYDILPGLSASYKLGLDQYSDRRKARIGSVPSPAGGFYSPGVVDYDNIFSKDINSDFLLSYNKQIGNTWSIDALVGHNYFATNYRRVAFDGNGLSVPDFYHISNASPGNAEEVIQRKRVNGAVAQANIGFRDMVYLNLTARNDWSSTLPEDDNSFFYPAASLGLEFTEMLGISDNDILPYGKLRVSYGQVGSDAPLYATSNYFAQTSVTGDGFTDGLVFPILGQNAFEQDGGLGNNELLPETTTTFEIGADLRFFNNRLGLDITYYNAETVDQILPVTISAASGFLTSFQNAGLVTNEGIEAVFNATPVDGPFRWDFSANFTTYENIVEEILPNLTNIFQAGFTSVSSNAIEGESYGSLFGESLQRVDDPDSPYNGELIIGEDGFPLNATESRVLGDPIPDWTMGITNSFSYKGVSLSALVDIRRGGDVWNGTYGIAQYFGVTQHSADFRGEAGDGVIFQGVQRTEAGEFVPNTQQVDLNNDAVGTGSNRWVRYGFGTRGEENIEDASWVRLREVRLSYSLPTSVVENLGVQGVDIALTGRNLLLFTGYKGIDPETNLTGTSNGLGLDYFNNPNTRGYGATLNVTF